MDFMAVLEKWTAQLGCPVRLSDLVRTFDGKDVTPEEAQVPNFAVGAAFERPGSLQHLDRCLLLFLFVGLIKCCVYVCVCLQCVCVCVCVCCVAVVCIIFEHVSLHCFLVAMLVVECMRLCVCCSGNLVV